MLPVGLIMAQGIFRLFLSISFCLFICSRPTCGLVYEEAMDLGVTNQINLFAAIHRLAFPNMISRDVPITEHLVMQMPGLVLSPADCNPGAKYHDAMADPYDGQPETNIPPYIMEKMFHLTDKVLYANPLEKGTTGKSFANAYSNVVYNLNAKNFIEIGENTLRDYNDASTILKASRYDPDSENPRNVTLYELYSRYKRRYYQKKKYVDNILEEKKKSLPSIQYQEWFVTNYPILRSELEAAYTRWTLYGEKSVVDAYKINLEVTTDGAIVEEAREMLRSYGFTALDRSSTIYPVTFTPHSWYHYIIPGDSPLTKDQVSTHIAQLESQIVMLETMYSQPTDTTEIEQFLGDVEGNLVDSRSDLEYQTSTLELLRFKCKKQQHDLLVSGVTSQPVDDECVKYRAQEDNVEKSLKIYSSAYSLAQLTADEYSDTSSTKVRVSELIELLRGKIADLTNTLNKAPLYISGITPNTRQVTEQEQRDGWTYFEFDSTDSTNTLDPESDTYRDWFNYGVKAGLWDARGTVVLSGSTSEVSASVINSHFKVKAKVLKVDIHRPWFKEEIFHNTNLKLAKNVSVSPGPMSERDYVFSLNIAEYLLPEYTNAFLLVKDLSIQFSAMDLEYSGEAVLKAGSGDFSAAYGPFTIGAAVQYQHEISYTQETSATGGISLKIPGAQIIGYYSTILPKFPVG